jgi:hypothetical protein
MDKDSLAQHLLNVLASTATVAGKTINTTPLTDEQKKAEIARLQAYSQPMAAQVTKQGQVGCSAAPNPQPTHRAPAVPEDGRVYLVNTYACRTAIKISGQAIYDPQVRRWYLIKPDSYNLIPPQCLPKGYKSASHKPSEDPDQPAVTKPQDSFQTWHQAGAGGRAARTAPHADQAPTRPAAPASIPEPVPVVQSPASRADTPRSATVLPWWPKEVRGVPNLLIRTALFGVVRRGWREYLDRVPIASRGNITITYSGPQLDQADLDVWMQILEMRKGQELGRLEFSASSFLRSIGRGTDNRSIEWLYSSLARLAGAVVDIRDAEKHHSYFGALILDGARDERTNMISVALNPNLLRLFLTGWVRLDWQQRRMLNTDLAKWLHAFYSSDTDPYPIKVQTIRDLCGSESKVLKKFRQQLRASLAQLEKVAGWQWEIDSKDLVHVRKNNVIP